MIAMERPAESEPDLQYSTQSTDHWMTVNASDGDMSSKNEFRDIRIDINSDTESPESDASID